MSKIQISPRTEHIDDILRELFSFHRFGIKPGLENITALLQAVDNPQTQYRTIHIAGTNGKGTVSSVLASILMEAGYKVGLYTSPHILRFNERIRVNGQEISDEEIASLASVLLPTIREIAATFFEATTAMAFRYFADQQVDIAIIETGLGGRLDSTNVLLPLVSVITSIDLDHMEFLGTTLPEIAAEKAGIIKPGIPAVIGEPRRELREVFDRVAAEQNALIIYTDDAYRFTIQEYYPDFSMRATFTTPTESLENVIIPLSGEHMARNIATVLAVYDLLANQPLESIKKEENGKSAEGAIPQKFPKGGIPVIDREAILRGITHVRKNAGLKGRIELLQACPPLVLDVAHNGAGIDALVQTLQKSGYADTRWNIVFGAMKDKAVNAMVTAFRPIAGTLYAVAPAVERAMTPSGLQSLAAEENIPSISFPSVAAALEAALSTGLPTLIVGSFYVADEALRVIQGRD